MIRMLRKTPAAAPSRRGNADTARGRPAPDNRQRPGIKGVHCSLEPDVPAGPVTQCSNRDLHQNPVSVALRQALG